MSRRVPTVIQAFILVACGAALAFFGCLGALSGGNDTAFAVGGSAFALGLLAFLAGGVWLMFLVIRATIQTFAGARTPPPADPPSAPPSDAGGAG